MVEDARLGWKHLIPDRIDTTCTSLNSRACLFRIVTLNPQNTLAMTSTQSGILRIKLHTTSLTISSTSMYNRWHKRISLVGGASFAVFLPSRKRVT